MSGSAGILQGVAKWEVFGLPFGAVATGAIIGGVGDVLAGVTTGFAPQAPSWAVKGALAFAVGKYAGRLVGTGAASIGALFLTYDAVQEIFNIRASTRNILGGITGNVVKQSPPRFMGANPGGVGSGSYYGKAMGVS